MKWNFQKEKKNYHHCTSCGFIRKRSACCHTRMEQAPAQATTRVSDAAWLALSGAGKRSPAEAAWLLTPEKEGSVNAENAVAAPPAGRGGTSPFAATTTAAATNDTGNVAAGALPKGFGTLALAAAHDAHDLPRRVTQEYKKLNPRVQLTVAMILACALCGAIGLLILDHGREHTRSSVRASNERRTNANFNVYEDVEFPGHDLSHFHHHVATPMSKEGVRGGGTLSEGAVYSRAAQCAMECTRVPGCTVWTFDTRGRTKYCYLKWMSANRVAQRRLGFVSGVLKPELREPLVMGWRE